jgi:hypothetical protein
MYLDLVMALLISLAVVIGVTAAKAS